MKFPIGFQKKKNTQKLFLGNQTTKKREKSKFEELAMEARERDQIRERESEFFFKNIFH